MMPEGLETVQDLEEALTKFNTDLPIYARTPHGSYQFLIKGVEEIQRGNENVAMIVLQEVAKETLS